MSRCEPQLLPLYRRGSYDPEGPDGRAKRDCPQGRTKGSYDPEGPGGQAGGPKGTVPAGPAGQEGLSPVVQSGR